MGQNTIPKNIKFGFKIIWIWPLKFRAMNDKLLFSEVYTTIKNNKINEEIYNFDDKANGSLRWGGKFVVTSFVFIVKTSVATNGEDIDNFPSHAKLLCGDDKESNYHQKRTWRRWCTIGWFGPETVKVIARIAK